MLVKMFAKTTKNKLGICIFLGLFLWMECYYCSFENLKESMILRAEILSIT